jgi:hypothetical protein
MSVKAKFIRYFLKPIDVFFFLTRKIIADIFVTNAIKAVPPYSRVKIDGKGSGSANNSDNSVVRLDIDRFAKYSLSKAKIGSIL